MEFIAMTRFKSSTRAILFGVAIAALPAASLANDALRPMILAESGDRPILFNNSSNSRQQGAQAVRMGQLEDHIRRLHGQVEELNHQIRVLQEQMRRMQEDNEFRFQELESRKGRRKRSQAPVQNNDAAAVPQDQVLGTIPADENGGELPDPIARAIGQPLDLSTLAGESNLRASVPPEISDAQGLQPVHAPSGDARADYDTAYGLVLRGDYAQAESSFRNFIDLYPQDRLAANAKYWLAESLYAQKRYQEAADAFLVTYSEHPASDKAPDSLLKLGQSLYGMGERGAACSTYSELMVKYPQAASALRRRATGEMQRAQC